jgi:hypothetical protein
VIGGDSYTHGWLSSAGCFLSYKNASFGSHADRFFPGSVGFWLLERSPRFATTAVANTLTVATPPIFIDRVDLKKVMRNSYENARLKVDAALYRGVSFQH